MGRLMRRDRSVVRRAEADFETLLAANFDDVWRFVRRRTLNASDADDVTSQVFVTAWRRREDMPSGDEQRLWLFGVARLSLSNHRRAAQRQSNLRLRLIDTAPRDPYVADPVEGRLTEAFGALLPDDREILMMRAWDGLAVTEIAGLLGCSPNAASLRLHKARRRLQLLLEEKDQTRAGHVPVEPTGEDRR